jgi:hypothetical protein
VCSINSEFPLAPEIALYSGFCVSGNDGDEQPTLVDLFSDLAIPGIAPSQFLAIEPDFNTGGAKCLANPSRCLRIL